MRGSYKRVSLSSPVRGFEPDSSPSTVPQSPWVRAVIALPISILPAYDPPALARTGENDHSPAFDLGLLTSTRTASYLIGIEFSGSLKGDRDDLRS
jgi:hypothetical protein